MELAPAGMRSLAEIAPMSERKILMPSQVPMPVSVCDRTTRPPGSRSTFAMASASWSTAAMLWNPARASFEADSPPAPTKRSMAVSSTLAHGSGTLVRQITCV